MQLASCLLAWRLTHVYEFQASVVAVIVQLGVEYMSRMWDFLPMARLACVKTRHALVAWQMKRVLPLGRPSCVLQKKRLAAASLLS
ncbi:hypothetical protein [Chromobacterium amazonense]|uniref:hypothetical protein n=1 Tax=Chromobacterium amazonense TaxID=1382803 RepID=UPI0031F60A4F